MAQYRSLFGLTICWFLHLSQLLADSSGLHWLLCVVLIGFVGRVGAAKKLQGYTEMGEIDTKMIDYDKLESDLHKFAHWFSEKQLITKHSFPLRFLWSNRCQSLTSLSGRCPKQLLDEMVCNKWLANKRAVAWQTWWRLTPRNTK